MSDLHKNLGVHILLDLYECPAEIITSAAKITEIGREVVSYANLKSLKDISHQFEPQGATALFLLSESHLSIHTWPEKGIVACDVFCCTDMQTLDEAKTKAEKASEKLAELFQSKSQQTQVIIR